MDVFVAMSDLDPARGSVHSVRRIRSSLCRPAFIDISRAIRVLRSDPANLFLGRLNASTGARDMNLPGLAAISPEIAVRLSIAFDTSARRGLHVAELTAASSR